MSSWCSVACLAAEYLAAGFTSARAENDSTTCSFAPNPRGWSGRRSSPILGEGRLWFFSALAKSDDDESGYQIPERSLPPA